MKHIIRVVIRSIPHLKMSPYGKVKSLKATVDCAPKVQHFKRKREEEDDVRPPNQSPIPPKAFYPILKEVTHPKGTRTVLTSDEGQAKINWEIIGDCVKEFTDVLQQEVDKRAAAGFPFTQPKYSRKRNDPATVVFYFLQLVKANLYRKKNADLKRAATWFRKSRNCWGHILKVFALNFPTEYLSSIIILAGPDGINSPRMVNMATDHLRRANLPVLATLPKP